jgi:hypothetical protein
LCVIAKVNILRKYQGECVKEEISPLLENTPQKKKEIASQMICHGGVGGKSYTEQRREMPIMGLQIKCPPQFNLIHTIQKEVYEARRGWGDDDEKMRRKAKLEYYTQFNGINFFNQIPMLVVTARHQKRKRAYFSPVVVVVAIFTSRMCMEKFLSAIVVERTTAVLLMMTENIFYMEKVFFVREVFLLSLSLSLSLSQLEEGVSEWRIK